MHKKQFMYISVAYFLAHVLLLLVNGIWWDDWFLVYLNKNVLWEYGLMMGRPSAACIWMFARVLRSINIYQGCLVFILYYISTICLYFSLCKIDFLEEKDAFCIAILFGTLYINDARVLMACLPYAVSNTAFFAAYYLFLRWQESGFSGVRILYRAILLLLFIIAFTTNSFLVFYAIFLLYLLYIIYKQHNIFNIGKYADFFLLPIAFYVLKHRLFPTYEHLLNYNKVTMLRVEQAFKTLLPSVYNSSVYQIVELLKGNIVLVMLLVMICLLFCVSNVSNKINVETKSNVKTTRYIIYNIIFGLFLIVLAVFPYRVVVPLESLKGMEFLSRHLMLVALGLSWVIYFVILLVVRNKRVGIFIILLFVVLNIVQWNKTYFAFQLDWYKQKLLIAMMREEPDIKNNQTFAFNDMDQNINVKHNTYRFYAFAGMFKEIFKEEKRFCALVNEISRMPKEKHRFDKYFLLGQYTGDCSKIDRYIIFKCNLNAKDTFKLRYYDFVGSDKLRSMLKEKGSLKVLRYIE